MLPPSLAIPAFLCAAAGLVWAPFSAWLLQRARSAARTHAAANAALTAERALDLFRITRRDTLTGLATRQAFTETLSAQFARDANFALFLFDLDGFETINTNHGESTGDELLLAFTARLRTLTPERDHAARLDGDGFALLLTRPDELEDLPATAARLRAALAAPLAAAGQLVDLAVSFGVAAARVHGQNTETLLRAARSALAQAKGQGRGSWHVCGQVQAEAVLTRQRVRRELQAAIQAGQIVPYYQPIIRLPDGEIAKFEVLARWVHPTLGVLLPEQFIPMADEMGLAGQISMSLLRQLATDTQDWPAWCRVAINVSPGQVRELIGLLQAQPGAWQRRMDLSRLDVELSEAALDRDRALARELIDVLHEHNARAVLDDFGSGSSNFFHLRDMPFDTIKIGKVFVQTLTEDPRAEACVAAMLWLGLGLGIDIVADGVETQETADRLASLGCHYAQGFLYARPGPAASACALLGVETFDSAKEAA